MNHSNPLVAVVCGSKSDEDYVKQTISVLEELDIPYISEVVSAHRDPERLHSWIRDAEDMGVKVFIGPFSLGSVGVVVPIIFSGIKVGIAMILIFIWIFILTKIKNWIFKSEVKS